METAQPTFRLDDARAPLWFGYDAGWATLSGPSTPARRDAQRQ
jgi:hypothetical protein